MFREEILDVEGDAEFERVTVMRADAEALGVTETVCVRSEDCEGDAEKRGVSDSFDENVAERDQQGVLVDERDDLREEL